MWTIYSGQGCNPQEIYDQIRPILIKIIKNKFKLSKAKFKISTQLNFGDYTIEVQKSKTNKETQVTIKPNLKKIEAIQNFPTPKNKTDLMSFLGLVKTLNTYTQKISEVSESLQKLTHIKTHFIWDQKDQK